MKLIRCDQKIKNVALNANPVELQQNISPYTSHTDASTTSTTRRLISDWKNIDCKKKLIKFILCFKIEIKDDSAVAKASCSSLFMLTPHCRTAEEVAFILGEL